MPLPLFLARYLFATDFSEDWGDTADAPHPGEPERAAAERDEADDDLAALVEMHSRETGSPPSSVHFPVVDLERKAATTRYRHNGKIKRTRYRRVNLAKRVVVIVIHQMGVERAESSTRWHHTTCHRCIGAAGKRHRVHPLDVRLIAANALDRKPFHAITIEVEGNLEQFDGDGKWWMPDKMGSGRASVAQIIATRQEVEGVIAEVAALGGRVVAILPHRISGRNKKGKPNRPLCPGERLNAEVVEFCAREHGLAVAGDDFTLGGTVVPDGWHGAHWCDGDGLARLVGRRGEIIEAA